MTVCNKILLKAKVEQIAWGSFGCTIPEGIQGQVGCSSEQPGLADVAAHSRRVGMELGDLQDPLPTLTIQG